MKFTAWQLIVLIRIVVLGAQLPMFALANSIDNDEAAKSCLGVMVSAVFGATFTSIMFMLQKAKDKQRDHDGS